MTGKIQFLASDDTRHQADAGEWKKIMAIDPGAAFSDPPCGCCKTTLVFAWKHCPACGGVRKQVVNRLPNWDCFCLECGWLYSIRELTERYQRL
jgi:hypothetical protein